MLLNSLFLIITLFVSNIYIQIILFFILIIINLFKFEKFKQNLKKIKFMSMILFFTFIFQIIYINEGKIFFKFSFIIITDIGILKGLELIFKILNIMMISWLIDYNVFFKGKFAKYKEMVRIVMKLIPEVFSLFKKRSGVKKTFYTLLRKVYKELN